MGRRKVSNSFPFAAGSFRMIASIRFLPPASASCGVRIEHSKNIVKLNDKEPLFVQPSIHPASVAVDT